MPAHSHTESSGGFQNRHRSRAEAEDLVQDTLVKALRAREQYRTETNLRAWLLKILRNTLPYSCPSLGFEERFTYSVTNGELCAVDTITVLESAGGLSRGATCGLGNFQPVTLAK